jgi:sporulation protein YlmC with PRC-barrel domain
MLRRLSELKGIAVEATDGDAGVVEDVYFDRDAWVAGRLGVKAGNGLPGPLVAIPTATVLGVYLNGLVGKAVAINLTRRQVQHSPQIEADPQAARSHRAVKVKDQEPRAQAPNPDDTHDVSHTATIDQAEAREVLSAAEMSHDDIVAEDGELGHVKDLVVDDKTWRLHYLIVGTRRWWPSEKVLIHAHDIGGVDAAQAKVHLKLTRDEIRRAPEYDPNVLPNG